MGKNLYLNDVPVDVFLDYFDKTTYAETNKNEQVWEESDSIFVEPYLDDDNNIYSSKTGSDHKNQFKILTITTFGENIESVSFSSYINAVDGYIASANLETEGKRIIEFMNKFSSFSFSKVNSLFECYYNINDDGDVLSIAIKIEPYKVPKVNDKGENIYRDAQGLLTTKASYDNNFFTHQKALRKAFAGLTENNSWMYRCNPRTLSIVSDKGKEYFSYYDQCVKTVKYEEIASEISIVESLIVSDLNRNYISVLNDEDEVFDFVSTLTVKPSNYIEIVYDGKTYSWNDNNKKFETVINDNGNTEDLTANTPIDVSFNDNLVSWNGEVLIIDTKILDDKSLVKYQNSDYIYDRENSKLILNMNISSNVIPKKLLGTSTKELLKIENRLNSLNDYPVYSIYSTAKDAKLLEAPTTFYIEDDRYVCRESGFYIDGIENPEYIYKIIGENAEKEKVELANKNLYFMNASAFYCENDKLELKDGMELIFGDNLHTYQTKGFYTEYKGNWRQKLGLKDWLTVNKESTILKYYSANFFKLKSSADLTFENKTYSLSNQKKYWLALEEAETLPNDSENITYNNIPGWSISGTDLVQDPVQLIGYPTKIKKSDRIFTWNGIVFDSEISLNKTVSKVFYNNSNWDINFDSKTLNKIEYLKYTTVVTANNRTYKFNGTNLVTEPLSLYLPKNVDVIYNGDTYTWNGKKLKRLLVVTVEPETNTKIIYNGKTYTWNGSSWGTNIPNKAKVKYNGDSNWKWYTSDKKLDKLFKLAKTPQKSTEVTYNGLTYKWNGSNFVRISEDDVTLNAGLTATYQGLDGWTWNSDKTLTKTVALKKGVFGVGATMVEYNGLPYYWDGDEFRTLLWIKLPPNVTVNYKGIDGWSVIGSTIQNTITAESSSPITVKYKNTNYTWNGERFKADTAIAKYLPSGASVTYKNESNWIWQGKTLTNTVKFKNNLKVTYEGLQYTYSSKKDLFTNKKSVTKSAVNSSYTISYNGGGYDSVASNSTVNPKLPTVVLTQKGKKATFNGTKFVPVDSSGNSIVSRGDKVIYQGISNYEYIAIDSNGERIENDNLEGLEYTMALQRTIPITLGMKIYQGDKEFTNVGSVNFKEFKEYLYSGIGCFYEKNGTKITPNGNTYLRNSSNIYRFKPAGFYQNDNQTLPESFANGDTIKYNNKEYAYFAESGFYNCTSKDNINKLEIIPGMSIIYDNTIYTYRTGWLFEKDKYKFTDGDTITFKNENYKYQSNVLDYQPANYFYDTIQKKQLTLVNNMIITKDKDYFIYHEANDCFYKRSISSLGSIIYSPELEKRSSSLSENIFPGSDPQPEVVLLNVYDRTFKIKNKPEWTMRLNDDDSVYVYYEITETENTSQIKKDITLDEYKNVIFDAKSKSPYLLLPVFSNKDSLTGKINQYLHIEIPAAEGAASTLVLNGKIVGDNLNAASVKLEFGDGEFESIILTSNEIGMSDEQRDQLNSTEETYFVKIDLEKIDINICRQMLCEVARAKETKIERVDIERVQTRTIKSISYRVARSLLKGIKLLIPKIHIETDTYTETVCKNVPVIRTSNNLYRIYDYFKMDFSNEPIEKFYNIQNPSQQDINDFLKFGQEKLQNYNLTLEGSIFKDEEYFENYYSINNPYIKKTTTYQFLKSSHVLMLEDPKDTVLSKNLDWSVESESGYLQLARRFPLPKVTEIIHNNTLYKWDGNNFVDSANKNLIGMSSKNVLYVDTIYKTLYEETINGINPAVLSNYKYFNDSDTGLQYYWNGVKYINTKELRNNISGGISYLELDNWNWNKTNKKLSISGIEITNDITFDKINVNSTEYKNVLYDSSKFYSIINNNFYKRTTGNEYDTEITWDGRYINERLIPKQNHSITYNNEVYKYDTSKRAYINTSTRLTVRTIFNAITSVLKFLFRTITTLVPVSIVEIYTETKKLKNNITLYIDRKYYNYANGYLTCLQSPNSFGSIQMDNNIKYEWNPDLKRYVDEIEIPIGASVTLDYKGLTNCVYSNGKVSNTIDVYSNMEIRYNSMTYIWNRDNDDFITKDIISDIPENDTDIIGTPYHILVRNKYLYTWDGKNFVNEKNEILDSEIKKAFICINDYSYNPLTKLLLDKSDPNKKITLEKPEKYVVKTSDGTEYIWDGVNFNNKLNKPLSENGKEVTNLSYLGYPGYSYQKIAGSTGYYEIALTHTPSLTTSITFGGLNYSWDGEKFVTEESISVLDEKTPPSDGTNDSIINGLIIISTYEKGWSWNCTNRILSKDGKIIKPNLSMMVVQENEDNSTSNIFYYNGSDFVRKTAISDLELSNIESITYNNESGYTWNGFQLVKGDDKVTPTLATEVFYDGLTYTWDGYNFSFGDLDKYPSTEKNPEFNNLDVEGLPITKETIQQRYNHAGRYFVNEVSRLRGDYIQGNIFYKDRIESLKKMLKNIIENEESEIQLKTESMKNNGFTNVYNYCQGLNNFVKKDVNLISAVQIPERLLISPKEIYTKLILAKVEIRDETSERIENIRSEILDERSLLERVAEYKTFPANFMYEDYLKTLMTNSPKKDKVYENININPNYIFEKQRHIYDYRKAAFEGVLNNVFKEIQEVIRNGSNTSCMSISNLKADSDYYKIFYESKLRQLVDFNNRSYTAAVLEKKVFTSTKDETDLMLLDLMEIDNDEIWEVLNGNIE